MNKRPIVISIIAVLLLINGILTLINAYRFQARPVVPSLGVVALLLSVGLWQLRSWAWAGTILLQLVAIGFAIYDWFTDGPIDFLAMIMGVLILLYFLRANTRNLFFRSGSESGEPI